MKEILLRFYNTMSQFNRKIPLVVVYNNSNHELTYRQLTKLKSVPFMKPYYLPKKNFKVGILTPSKLAELMEGIQVLLEDPGLNGDEPDVTFSINQLSLKAYKLYHSRKLVGPQLYQNLRFVNITNPILVWVIMRFYSIEVRTFYKLMKNEKELEKRENSLNQVILKNKKKRRKF